MNEGHALPGRILAERYSLQREVGHGATAVVYLAHDLHAAPADGAPATVAVKVLRDEFVSTSSAADRFIREVRVTGGLDHPAILQILDSLASRTSSNRAASATER